MSSNNTNTQEQQIRQWEIIYQKILDDKQKQFPPQFWEDQGRKKVKHLLRYYVNQTAIGLSELKEGNKRQIIASAKLRTPLEQLYNNNSVRMVSDAFPYIDKKNLRWTINRKIDWERVLELRKKCCSLRYIGQEIGCLGSTIARRADSEDIDLSVPGDKSTIYSPVNEVEYFWRQAEKAKERKITLEQMMQNLKKENGWSESKIHFLMLEHDIKKAVRRYGSMFRKKTIYADYKNQLHPTEKLVAENLNKNELEVLESYGADFLYKNQTIIEVKKSISSYSLESALLQLTYAKDLLDKGHELAIYTESYDITQSELSMLKRILNFYRINIYEYNKEKEVFRHVNYNNY